MRLINNLLNMNKMIDEDKKLDIYSFMKSDVIREYMRLNRQFDIYEKTQIILYSFFPIEKKISTLKELAIEADDEAEKQVVMDVLYGLNRIIEVIDSSEGYLFSVKTYSGAFVDDDLGAYCNDHREYYYRFDDFFEKYKEYKTEGESTGQPLKYFTIDVIPLVATGYQYPQIVSVEATYFDNELGIYAVCINDEWACKEGFTEEAIDIFEDGIRVFGLYGYSLPFSYGEHVMLKTPFMNKPMCGSIFNVLDEYGGWTQFFRYKDKRSGEIEELDLSYHELIFGNKLSVFDWLYEADDIESELYYDEEINLDEVGMISEIKANESVMLKCHINEVRIKDGVVEVILQDSTGIVNGIINVHPNDYMWVTNIAENRGEILVYGMVKLDENDEMLINVIETRVVKN